MNSPLALALELEGLAPAALIARLRSWVGLGARRPAVRL